MLCEIERGRGEVAEVSVDEGWRRRGLARALLAAGLRALQARGVQSVRLHTLAGNAPARALYTSMGFRLLKEFHRYRKTLVAEGQT